MSIIVTKSSPVVVAGPSELGTATGGIINLSSFDKCFAPVPVGLLLIFEQPINEPIETIKKALSQALVLYQPMAGRLVTGPDDEPIYILCTGEGVLFVGASASCALEQFRTSPLLLGDLAVRYPAEYCLPGDPMLLMQVTEFACGGFVVGVTWNHVLADAAGMAQFLQAVGELARGMPVLSVLPVRSEADGMLLGIPPSVVTAMRSQMRVGMEEMAGIDVTISWSLISCIKAECGGDCTVFDAVAAVLWQCRTRAVISDPDTPAPLVFPWLVRAKHGYYGNCVMGQPVQAQSGLVANSYIKDLVKLIRLAKEKTPDILTNGGGGDQQQQVATPKYNKLVVTSWRKLGLNAVDFGRGGPLRVLPPPSPAERTAMNICILCPPCKGKDGVNIVSHCVKPEHADAFRRELAATMNLHLLARF
ncbi:hypothetical protein CFC21_020608 [Triticum aestivum]|uniref:Uncharacterized protein n=3 Tax=Triticum TaxID=4564 RepID=A0A1D5UD38_WHEAT|nr:acyl transferase 15-like [Triticum dicoccoides]XP_037488374.1 acyl transferase 15-like [Triticum dicoccoides]XP_044318796.1 acyl transferase 15-like [Triticum aestivum]XP_044318799.1 acyl transferase 15-like [Triticum aestivum]VAH39800.1 unnamed protein product [Triticum turgidum subsp. durum]KAF7005489.1 hypothetical protein CFC21_020606 [Triticum aestivum]KAF7005491.1 hypothetical protein CFC21_020608 [Triticum aestivum]